MKQRSTPEKPGSAVRGPKARSRPGGKGRSGTPPGEIRLIGGLWKRSKLPVPDQPGLRPTPDRVRETLFNWLGQDLTDWICIDAFAGTGALGFEAASRGAAQVLMVESHPGLVVQLSSIRDKLQATMVRIERGDGLLALARTSPDSVDLVFLDPPFDAGVFDHALKAAQRVLKNNGFIYLEAPTAWTEAQLVPLALQLRRHLRAGAVHAHLLQRIA